MAQSTKTEQYHRCESCAHFRDVYKGNVYKHSICNQGRTTYLLEVWDKGECPGYKLKLYNKIHEGQEKNAEWHVYS